MKTLLYDQIHLSIHNKYVDLIKYQTAFFSTNVSNQLGLESKIWWVGNRTLLLRIENFPLQKTYVFRLHASSSLFHFNHKGFVICSKNRATYVLRSCLLIKNIHLFNYSIFYIGTITSPLPSFN